MTYCLLSRHIGRSGRGFGVHCNLMARRGQPLADDLDDGPGRVSTRVALLLRGTERKPDVR